MNNENSEKKSSYYDNEPERDIVFHYSREHRLSRASQAVRDLDDEKPLKRGIFRALLSTQSNKILFFSIAFICALFFLVTRFHRNDGDTKLGENTIMLTINREEGMPVMHIVKNTPKRGEFYSGAVDISVTPVINEPEKTGDTPIFAHRIYFNPVVSETYTIILPFAEESFFVFLNTDFEQKFMRINVKGK